MFSARAEYERTATDYCTVGLVGILSQNEDEETQRSCVTGITTMVRKTLLKKDKIEESIRVARA